MPTQIEGVKLYTLLETAKKLELTIQTVRTHIDQEKLKATRIGNKYLVTENNIREYLKNKSNT